MKPETRIERDAEVERLVKLLEEQARSLRQTMDEGLREDGEVVINIFTFRNILGIVAKLNKLTGTRLGVERSR